MTDWMTKWIKAFWLEEQHILDAADYCLQGVFECGSYFILQDNIIHIFFQIMETFKDHSARDDGEVFYIIRSEKLSSQ